MSNIDNNYNPSDIEESHYQAANTDNDDLMLHSGEFINKNDNYVLFESVLNHIHKEIADTLDKCGIYYRMTSRVKSIGSTNKKLSTKINNGEWVYRHKPKNHMQDLFGFRILLYFVEDMPILKRLLHDRFSCHSNWEEKTHKKEEFGAISTNGIFVINKECFSSSDEDNLSDKLRKALEGQLVDPTFEIQLRTVTFDGWHEIDHDYTYKFTNMWIDQSEYLRRFHSILATLELCDDTMVSTLENLAYDIYARKRHPNRYKEYDNTQYICEETNTKIPTKTKTGAVKDDACINIHTGEVVIEKNIVTEADKGAIKTAKRSTLCTWDRMIRSHFRLRVEHKENVEAPDQELLPEIQYLFETEKLSEQKESYKFVKYVLRFRKETLINLFYDPKAFLKKTKEDYHKLKETKETDKTNKSSYASGSSEAEVTKKQIWENYNFKSKIPITVNSIIIMILLYKDAREDSLSGNQSALLVKDNIKNLVCESHESNIIKIAKAEGKLFNFLSAYKFTQGWNTVLKNDLHLTTNFASEDIFLSSSSGGNALLEHMLNIISQDMTALWNRRINKIPTTNDILSTINTSGKYVLNTDDKRYKMSIRIESEIIFYYIEYPGLQHIENTWRQMVAFIPKIHSNIREAKGDISINLSLAIQLLHDETKPNNNLPVITDSHIFQVMRAYSKNGIYPARPYIGQKKAFRERTHGTDVIYIKKHVINDAHPYELMISQYFEQAYNDENRIHPLILLLFDSEKALYDAELTVAQFYNRIAHTAYVYMGIIKDENDPVFSEYYTDEKECFISLNDYGITECGLYVIGRKPDENKNSCLLSLSSADIDAYDYQNSDPDDLKIPETIYGLEGILLLLERELIKYNIAMPMPPKLSIDED